MIDTRFPEALFPPVVDAEDYANRIKMGEEEAKATSVIFCGMCRDVGSVIDATISRIYKTAKLFKDYRIVLYENDSKDDTVKKIKMFSDIDSKFTLISESRETSNWKEKDDHCLGLSRATELADCRNEYMDHISSMEDLDDFKYVIVLDLDIIGGWSYEGILHSLSFLSSNQPVRDSDTHELLGLESIDAVTSNGVLTEPNNVVPLENRAMWHRPKALLFFDIWAFRFHGQPLIQERALSRNNFINIDRGQPPFAVESNFNGLAIYKTSPFVNFRYSASKPPEQGFTVNCDHPSLHRAMNEAGCNIVLNPSMIVSFSSHRFCKTAAFIS